MNINAFVKEAFGPDVAYHRGADSPGGIPNGIISRYPIKKSGTWVDKKVGNRDFEWALIDIPGDIDLMAVSVHLLTKTTEQGLEADNLVKFIEENVPDNVYLVVGGDFNTKTRTSHALVSLNDVVVTQDTCYPADSQGNQCSSQNRDHYYDGIYANMKLHKKEVPLVIPGVDEVYECGLVFDSTIFDPLDAVYPIREEDSVGNQMQHFPILRDFKIW